MVLVKQLEWTLSKSLLQDRPFSAAASVCISREAWKYGRLQHQSTGYLRTRGQEAFYETCAACALSVTSEESLRYSEPPLTGYPSTKGQETS